MSPSQSCSLDAVEFVGPYDDEKLGFYKVAKYYYFPGWWEGGAMLHMIVNDEKWASLPKQYQAILNQAGSAAGAKPAITPPSPDLAQASFSIRRNKSPITGSLA